MRASSKIGDVNELIGICKVEPYPKRQGKKISNGILRVVGKEPEFMGRLEDAGQRKKKGVEERGVQ